MSFIGFAVIAFLLTFGTAFFTALGLMDGNLHAHSDAYFVKRNYYIVGALVALFALYWAGLA